LCAHVSTRSLDIKTPDPLISLEPDVGSQIIATRNLCSLSSFISLSDTGSSFYLLKLSSSRHFKSSSDESDESSLSNSFYIS